MAYNSKDAQMTTDESSRAHKLAMEFQPHCEKVEIRSIDPKHFQFSVWRKGHRPLSTLFGDGDDTVYPFDYWCADQTLITWSAGRKSKYWIGYLADKTKVTIIVEK